MSVHGEYARALDGLIEALAASTRPDRAGWIEALEAARATQTRDLSTAARAAGTILDRLEADLDGGAPKRADDPNVRDACHHLRAHCHAILGPVAGRR
ncbi:MAG: hypothetical protein U0900_09200 [Myxococcota bacterium]